MPLCTLHLISLTKQTTIKQFITSLQSWGIKPLTISKPIRWIITPEIINTADLLHPSHPYDLCLILPDTKPLPGILESKTNTCFTLQIGIPTRLINNFHSKNQSLLHPDPSTVPKLDNILENNPLIDPKSSQNLKLSPDLKSWVGDFQSTHTGSNAVSMLNLLAFNPSKKDSYVKYGQEFARTSGSKRGGDAKLVGHVVYPDSGSKTVSSDQKWDEIAFVHYPSITHFAEMLGSKDYQEVNEKYRMPALRDTCILFTSEIEVEELMKETETKAKL